jgi:hypothetical protein
MRGHPGLPPFPGRQKDVLDYLKEIAHLTVDAGADGVLGRGPHHSLGVEVYKGKPIFCDLGSFSFHTGYGGHDNLYRHDGQAFVRRPAAGAGRIRVRAAQRCQRRLHNQPRKIPAR